ncbi:ISAon1 family transposase N-terminal region protein [Arcticibacterium luteifluviistationis]|uniref:ISAon1 family transposase N-terminal region protein n=1 Tax=Arcticibacterium luteifluviistationis TaxID=1784714 RepID=UPI0019550A7F|nr:transposase family protein [Arcticibacterium luteifluviistationis]
MQPEILVDNFDLTKIEKNEVSSVLRIYLTGKGDTPKELSHLKLHSKGFFDKITIRDFPVGHYKVVLHIKRRKWKDLETGKNVARN